MKAIIKPGYDTCRQKLADIVPLEAPFTLFIAATQKCNFRCNYCTQSLSDLEKKKINLEQVHMSEEIFEKIVLDAKEFNGKIRKITFTGLGEPLVNLATPDMIKKFNDNKVARSYELITNAYLLNHDIADRLIESGLTNLKISIQGLNSKKYKEITGIDIDYNRLIDNIRYFYKNRGKCKVYIKIMDACFGKNESEEDFYKLFGGICDEIYVERLFNAQPKMEGKYRDKSKVGSTFYGEKINKREVCPLLFYFLQIDAMGNVAPCSTLGPSLDMPIGNVKDKALIDIWNSDERYELLVKHLRGKRNEIEYCRNCGCINAYSPSEDNLDNDREQILERIKERRKEWQK